MENQPQKQQQPTRPWSRLVSQVRFQPRVDPPQSRAPPPLRPTFVQALRPQMVIPSQPEPPPPPPAQTQAPPSAPAIEHTQTSSSSPPSPQQKTLAPTSVPSSPLPKSLYSSSLPTTPKQKTQEPAPSNASISTLTVNFPPKLPSSSLPTSPTRGTLEPTPYTAPSQAEIVESPPEVVLTSLPAYQMQRATAPLPSPPESPMIIKPSSKTPPQSPKVIPFAPPPSLSLPPSQLRDVPEPESKNLVAEHKNVLVQGRKEKLAERKHDEDKAYISQHGKKEGGTGNLHKEKENRKKLNERKDLGMSVITIAGENKGAYMELGSSNNKHGNKGNTHTLFHTAHKSDSRARKEGNESRSSSSEDGKSIMKEKSKSGLPMTAFLNSNVQTVNNSILFNASCTQNDPGIHFIFRESSYQTKGYMTRPKPKMPTIK